MASEMRFVVVDDERLDEMMQTFDVVVLMLDIESEEEEEVVVVGVGAFWHMKMSSMSFD